ncbi:hypothetical protein TWF192_001985, partial [Orbilia oligospora]
MGRIYQSIAFLALVTSIPFSHAHDHKGDERIKDGDHISYEPIDTILWLHILSMILAFGILFPLGMVLGLTRNRFHVPVQISATCIAIMGWFLGHGHDGRQFEDWNIHSIYAPFLGLLVVSQVGMGVYLKLHLERGWHGRVRGVVVRIHKVIGIIIPVASWVQMIFGGITA